VKKAEEIVKIAGEVAEEALKVAEEKGLTLCEVLQVPETMKAKILYELRQQETPFKREKPRT
jgi:hypothetical protein